ncbi:hypothetical protein EG329_000889 [Mollisiaceae sp. DMI_Dod_QoI]|nr:hypothetical protein EG329_000889 [Helotiales sp. DMI_Dod_QoI]
MVQTRSMAAGKAPKPGKIQKKSKRRPQKGNSTAQESLKDWLAQYPKQDWELLQTIRGWNMTFEPSQEDLIKRFEGKLFAPQIAPSEDFWSETRKEVIVKMVCDEAERLCKRKASPDIGLYINSEQVQEDEQIRVLAAKLIKDFKADKSSGTKQIRFLRLDSINKTRRYPEFIKEAKIIERNRVSILIQSPGSKSDLHTDVGQGGALSTGVKLWAFFPPTEKNMELMRQYYSLESQQGIKGVAKKEFWDTHALEHGVWLVQNAGELLYTPSEAPHAVFTFSWSILITAHVDTAVTFVRNLKHQRTELAFTGSENEDNIKRLYLCLHEITPEKVGKRLFLQLRDDVTQNWPGIEEVVKDRATRQEWREIVSALQKMFQGVMEEELPDCMALNRSRKRKRV